MLAGIMGLSLLKQGRLLGGHKGISFSSNREQQGVTKALATTQHSTDRRRHRKTADQTPQQAGGERQQQQQPGDSKAEPRPQPHSRQLLENNEHAAALGLRRASELESSSAERKQKHPSPHRPATASADSATDSSSGGSEAGDFAPEDSSSIPSSSMPGSRSSSRQSSTSSSSSSAAPDRQRRLLTEEDDAIFAAINSIARFMDWRERCASEVVQKLLEKGHDRQMAEKVVSRMQEVGLQSDARFAEMFARGQWLAKSLSPARIAYELRARKVAQEHIDAALVAVFGDSRQLAGHEAVDDQQEASWEQLVEVCRRRVDAMGPATQQKQRAKLASWLQRRGHSLATAFRMFEALGI